MRTTIKLNGIAGTRRVMNWIEMNGFHYDGIVEFQFPEDTRGRRLLVSECEEPFECEWVELSKTQSRWFNDPLGWYAKVNGHCYWITTYAER